MKARDWHRLSKKHYTQLLMMLLFIFLASPILRNLHLGRIILSALFLGTIALSIRPFLERNRFVFQYSAIVFIGFAFSVASGIKGFPTDNTFVQIVNPLIYFVFVSISIVLISQKLLLDREVTSDTILGGICVYFLIGYSWSFLYLTLDILLHNSFSSLEAEQYTDYIYFSFTTLTTLGYGDISPASDMAKTLTNLEAIVGQMYPSIFIARLVSLYISQDKSP